MSDGKGAAYIVPVPEDRARRVEAALEAVHSALGLACREAEGAAQDASRLRWTALGLVSALQGALVAALSGYETADLAAVLDPANPERIAPVALLLRRARSDAYLNPPERPDVSGSDLRAIERVLTVRNAAVHAVAGVIPAGFVSDLQRTSRLVQHLMMDAPAYNPAHHGLMISFLRNELARLRAALGDITHA